MRKTKPTNLTLGESVKNKARELAQAGGYKSLTALIEELIRQKHEAVCGSRAPGPVATASREGAKEAIAEITGPDNVPAAFSDDILAGKIGDTARRALGKKPKGKHAK